MAFIDYYKIMGISKDTPQKDIKAAYKKRAKQFHPDLHPDDPKAKAKFQALNEAYDVLNDPENGPNTTNTANTGRWQAWAAVPQAVQTQAALKDLISASLQEEASRTSSRKCSAEAADAHAATAAASNGDSTRLETKAGL